VVVVGAGSVVVVLVDVSVRRALRSSRSTRRSPTGAINRNARPGTVVVVDVLDVVSSLHPVAMSANIIPLAASMRAVLTLHDVTYILQSGANEPSTSTVTERAFGRTRGRVGDHLHGHRVGVRRWE
jgi:hypothetical protein